MAELSASEELDQQIEAIVAGSTAPTSDASQNIAPLVSIATELRALPREDFRARLKQDIMRRTVMSTTAAKKTNTIREGFHTITPYLCVREVHELIDFVKKAFGAEGTIHGTGSEGGLHSEYKIGDSIVMIGGGEAWRGTPMPASLHVYVENADDAYKRALEAGATSMYAPVDQDYGDREAGIKDLCGNHWFLSTRKGESYIPDGFHTVTPFVHPHGAAKMIEFLKPAFGAEEISRAQSPDGMIQHAVVRIGDSMLEMGEAHGEWQPMPATFYLYVDDVDAWYERAVAGGATSMEEPKDQPYGDRVGAVRDPFENVWYIGTTIGETAS
jgi:uncharacterized glyoxalase superfamily protein PhnB